jgi:hypothetical protein
MNKLLMILATTMISFGASAQYSEECDLGPCDDYELRKILEESNKKYEDMYRRTPQKFYQ